MQGTSQRKAAELLGIPQGILNRHLKKRNSLEESEETNQKRRHSSKVPLVDEAVNEWIKQSLHRGADFLSGPIVHEKAEEFAKKLNVQGDWKASEGWFSKFKKRKGLVHKKLHGEAKDADVQQRGLQQCGQAFANNMMRKTFLTLMKQASIFAPCLAQR